MSLRKSHGLQRPRCTPPSAPPPTILHGPGLYSEPCGIFFTEGELPPSAAPSSSWKTPWDVPRFKGKDPACCLRALRPCILCHHLPGGQRGSWRDEYLFLTCRTKHIPGSPRHKGLKKTHFIKNMRQYDTKNSRYRPLWSCLPCPPSYLGGQLLPWSHRERGARHPSHTCPFPSVLASLQIS